MAKRRREFTIYKYECNVTGKAFTATAKAASPGDLMSVEGYYQMYPEKDDRPEVVKKKIEVIAASNKNAVELREFEATLTPPNAGKKPSR